MRLIPTRAVGFHRRRSAAATGAANSSDIPGFTNFIVRDVPIFFFLKAVAGWGAGGSNFLGYESPSQPFSPVGWHKRK